MIWGLGCLGSLNRGLFHFGFIRLTSRILIKRLFAGPVSDMALGSRSTTRGTVGATAAVGTVPVQGRVPRGWHRSERVTSRGADGKYPCSAVGTFLLALPKNPRLGQPASRQLILNALLEAFAVAQIGG